MPRRSERLASVREEPLILRNGLVSTSFVASPNTVKPITLAETRSNRTTHEFGDKRWTFYELQGSGGYVTIRWYGSSNGYYGTGVDIRRKAAPSTDSTPAF